MIYPNGDNILPISATSNNEKCKDFDVDKVDLRSNNISTAKDNYKNQHKDKDNKVTEEISLDCNV